jgi:hypothetical protein
MMAIISKNDNLICLENSSTLLMRWKKKTMTQQSFCIDEQHQMEVTKYKHKLSLSIQGQISFCELNVIAKR